MKTIDEVLQEINEAPDIYMVATLALDWIAVSVLQNGARGHIAFVATSAAHRLRDDEDPEH